MSKLDSKRAKSFFSPESLQPQDLIFERELVSLPLIARLYRGAFKSGSGPNLSVWRKLACRIGYYGLGAVLHAPQVGWMTAKIRGQQQPIQFNCLNRQFNPLYFQKYAAGYELPVTAALLSLLPNNGVFYDIGSNWGYFSLLVARRPEFTGQIHAFEPWPASFTDLSSLVCQAHLEEIIATHPVALAANSGVATMASGRHSGLARVVAHGNGIPVATNRLDDLALAAPDFIKLDVEGFESSVLRGGEKTVRSAQPFVIFESSMAEPQLALETLQLLEAWGFQLFIPDLTAVADRPGVVGAALPPGTRLRLQLHPVTSRSRHLHQDYINLLACPPHSIPQISALITN